MRYASFWKRLKAYHADAWIVAILTILIDQFIPEASAQGMEDFAQQIQTMQQLTGSGEVASTGDILQSIMRGIVLGLVVSAIYNVAFVASSWQATPGKRWCGIMVVDIKGGRPNLAQSCVRHLACGLSTLMFCVGYLTVIFTREKTALHDVISNTRVIVKESV